MSKRKAEFPQDDETDEQAVINQPRTHRKRPTCVECFQRGKRKHATFADHHGKKYRLCTTHAKVAGTFTIVNPCLDCPKGKKKIGKFPDETGRKKQFCTVHAKQRGTYNLTCVKLSTASWEKSIKSGMVKMQIDEKTHKNIRLFRCSGVSGAQKEHYVSFEDIGKSAPRKHGVTQTCKRCSATRANALRCHTEAKRTLSLIYSQMYRSTRKRQKRFPAMYNVAWADKIIFIDFVTSTLALTSSCYQITGTCAGTISFPITLTSGYHNTVSIDRIDDSEGYIPSNVEIRPHFLNSLLALRSQDLRLIMKQRGQPRSQEEIEAVVLQLIEATRKTTGKFYKLADSAKSNMKAGDRKSRGLLYLGGKQHTFAWHLATIFMQLGGRCAYTGARSLLGFKQGPLMVSLERVNRDGDYNYDEKQTTLMVAGLNLSRVGQKYSQLCGSERGRAVRDGSFNQEYWNLSTNVTSEMTMAIDHAREEDRKRLQALFKVDKEMLQRIAAAKIESEQ